MLMGALALLVIASVPLTGARLTHLGQLRLRALWLLPTALGLQVLVINVVPDGPQAVLVPVHLVTYVLAALVIWKNRAVPGLVLLACGGAMNGITIAVNGGTLPASAEALARAGLSPDPEVFTNSGVLEDPRLAMLGDNFAIPAGVPFANVFSLGDVVIITAATYAVHRICRPSRPPVALPTPLLSLDLEQLRAEVEHARRALASATHRREELAWQLEALHRQAWGPARHEPLVIGAADVA